MHMKEYEQILEQMKRANVRYSMEQEDADYHNHTYREEQELLECVRAGDVGQARQIATLPELPYPREICHSEKRTEEYMAAIVVAVIARAAVEAGATSAESFTLSDVYLKKISEARDIEEIRALRVSAVIAYAELVAARKAKGKSGQHVEACKSYIAANIFKKISVGEIAEELSLNVNYLERIFKESEGITISRYILKEKIGRSKNLLVYSDRSIMEISEYLSFSSQSHFGKVFLQETGMTPRQYRQMKHMEGF